MYALECYYRLYNYPLIKYFPKEIHLNNAYTFEIVDIFWQYTVFNCINLGYWSDGMTKTIDNPIF